MDNKRDWLIQFDFGEAPASTLNYILLVRASSFYKAITAIGNSFDNPRNIRLMILEAD